MWKNRTLFLFVHLVIASQVAGKDFKTETLRVASSSSDNDELKIISVPQPGQEEVRFFSGAASSRKLEPLSESPVTVVRVRNPVQFTFQDGIWIAEGANDGTLQEPAKFEQGDSDTIPRSELARRGRQFLADEELFMGQAVQSGSPSKVPAFPSSQPATLENAAWTPITVPPSTLHDTLLHPAEVLPVVSVEVLNAAPVVNATNEAQAEKQRSLNLSGDFQVFQFGLEDALTNDDKAKSTEQQPSTLPQHATLIHQGESQDSQQEQASQDASSHQRPVVTLQEKIEGRAFTPEEENANLIPAESAVSSRTVIKKGENGQDYEYEYLYYYEDEVSDLKEVEETQDNRLSAGSDVTILQSEEMIPVPTHSAQPVAEQDISSSTDDILLLDLSSTEDLETLITSTSAPTTTTTSATTTTTTTTTEAPTTAPSTTARGSSRTRAPRPPARNRFAASSTTTTEATEQRVTSSSNTAGSTRSTSRGKVRFSLNNRNTEKTTADAPSENSIPRVRNLAESRPQISGRRTTTTTTTAPSSTTTTTTTRPSRRFQISSRTGLGASQEAREETSGEPVLNAPDSTEEQPSRPTLTLPELVSGGALPAPVDDDRLPLRTRFPPRVTTEASVEENKETNNLEEGGNASEDEGNTETRKVTSGRGSLRVVDSSSFRGASVEEGEQEAPVAPSSGRTRGRLTILSGPGSQPEEGADSDAAVPTPKPSGRTRNNDGPLEANHLYALSRALSMDSMEDNTAEVQKEDEKSELDAAMNDGEGASVGSTELPMNTETLSQEAHPTQEPLLEATSSDASGTNTGLSTSQPELLNMDVEMHTVVPELLALSPTTEVLMESTTVPQMSEAPTEVTKQQETTTTPTTTEPTTTRASRRTTTEGSTTTTTSATAEISADRSSTTGRGRGRFIGRNNNSGTRTQTQTTTTTEAPTGNVVAATTPRRFNFRRGSTAQAEQVTKSSAVSLEASPSTTETTTTTRRARPTFAASRFNFRRGPQNETAGNDNESTSQQPIATTARSVVRPSTTQRTTTPGAGIARPRQNLLHRGRTTTTTPEAPQLSEDNEEQEVTSENAAPNANAPAVAIEAADKESATTEAVAPSSTTLGSILGRLKNRPALTVSEKPKTAKPAVNIAERRNILRPRLNTAAEVKPEEPKAEEGTETSEEPVTPAKATPGTNEEEASDAVEATVTSKPNVLQNRLRARRPGQLVSRRQAGTQNDE